MVKKILVASPHEAFGELLRSSLEDSGRYHVSVAHTGKAVADLLRARKPSAVFDLAILDSDLPDVAVTALGRVLMEKFTDLYLIVIPPENDPNHLSLVNFTPHGYLNRPFYLPDLFDKLDHLLNPRSWPKNGSDPAGYQENEPEASASVLASHTLNLPPAFSNEKWLQAALQQHLFELLAAGALVSDGEDPVAFAGVIGPNEAGHLSRLAAASVGTAELTQRKSARGREKARFVFLRPRSFLETGVHAGAGFRMFTRPLASDLLLSVLFDEHTPLSQCRKNSARLAQFLLEKAQAYQPESPTVVETPPAPPAVEAEPPQSEPQAAAQLQTGVQVFPALPLEEAAAVPPAGADAIQDPDAALAAILASIDQPSSDPAPEVVQHPAETVDAGWVAAESGRPLSTESAPPLVDEDTPGETIPSTASDPAEAVLSVSVEQEQTGLPSLDDLTLPELDSSAGPAEDGFEADQINLSELLEDMPSPDPRADSQRVELPIFPWETAASKSADVQEPGAPAEAQPADGTPPGPEPAAGQEFNEGGQSPTSLEASSLQDAVRRIAEELEGDRSRPQPAEDQPAPDAEAPQPGLDFVLPWEESASSAHPGESVPPGSNGQPPEAGEPPAPESPAPAAAQPPLTDPFHADTLAMPAPPDPFRADTQAIPADTRPITGPLRPSRRSKDASPTRPTKVSPAQAAGDAGRAAPPEPAPQSAENLEPPSSGAAAYPLSESAPVSDQPARPAADSAVETPAAPAGSPPTGRKSAQDWPDTNASTLASLEELAGPVMPGDSGRATIYQSYTCILIPRLAHHTIDSRLAARLEHWIPQSAIAFGWFLEDVTIKPEYIQWTVQVTPTVSPGNLIRIIRQRTSEAIFTEFPYLREQSTYGDFWAPGYLVVRGTQPPSTELLRDFIYQTRRRQGVFRN